MSTNERKYRPVNLRQHEARAAARGELRLIVRVVKPVRGFEHNNVCRPDMAADKHAVWWHGKYESVGCLQECPYGRPGDGLWVRETFIHEPADYCWEASVSIPSRPAFTVYRADQEGDSRGAGWKSSVHMPRQLSRWSGVIQAVECRRVQTITNDEAVAAGAAQYAPARFWPSMSAVFREIFGDEWDSNPWAWFVWVRREGES